MTEKRAWRCRHCGEEYTPRCPACRVVISADEAQRGTCNMCSSPISPAIYTCPHCGTAKGLQPLVIQPWRGRGLAIKGLQLLRFIAASAQFAALILGAAACSASFGAVEPQRPGAPPLALLALSGLGVFIALIPVQIILAKVINRVSLGTVVIAPRKQR